MSAVRVIKVAAAQLPGWPLIEADRSLAAIEQAVTRAADAGAHMVVLPECAYPAYYLASFDAFRRSRHLDSSQLIQRLVQLARDQRIQMVCGFVEEAGNRLYNAAVCIDADGNECGRYRKNFLWGEDNTWFVPGERVAPIDTPIGRIGIMICADGRAPEIAASLVRQGAQLIVVPTCWVNVAHEPGHFANAQAEYMCRARAVEFGVPVVAANKFGRETDKLNYCGWSAIYAADGEICAQAPPDQPAVIDAEVRLAKPPKPTVPDWAARRILHDLPAVLPDSNATLRVAVLPARLLRDGSEEIPTGRLHALAGEGVDLVATSITKARIASAMETAGRQEGVIVVGYPFVERLMLEAFGAFGCVSGAHMRSFCAARVMALDGAALVISSGQEVPEMTLRTRAAENRVFVAMATDEKACLVDPDGVVVARTDASDSDPIIADIDLGWTANKLVFPGTDIWAQRRPALYRAAFEPTDTPA